MKALQVLKSKKALLVVPVVAVAGLVLVQPQTRFSSETEGDFSAAQEPESLNAEEGLNEVASEESQNPTETTEDTTEPTPETPEEPTEPEPTPPRKPQNRAEYLQQHEEAGTPKVIAVAIDNEDTITAAGMVTRKMYCTYTLDNGETHRLLNGTFSFAQTGLRVESGCKFRVGDYYVV